DGGRGGGEGGVGGGQALVREQVGDGGEGADAGGAVRFPGDAAQAGDAEQVDLGAGRPGHDVGAAGAQFAPGLADGLGGGLDGGHLPIPSSRRSGRMGRSCGRQPVACRTALPIEAATAMVQTSPRPTPRPGTWSQPSVWKYTSISGVSAMPGMW